MTENIETSLEILFEKFERRDKKSPNFRAGLSCVRNPNNLPPFRAYVHNTGAELYDSGHLSIAEITEDVTKQLISSLVRNPELVTGAAYLLAAMWGCDEKKIIDLFAFSDIGDWPGNPDVAAFVLENGVYAPENKKITCGDTLMVLGIEEKHRRRCTNLDDYMRRPPGIPDLTITALYHKFN